MGPDSVIVLREQFFNVIQVYLSRFFEFLDWQCFLWLRRDILWFILISNILWFILVSNIPWFTIISNIPWFILVSNIPWFKIIGNIT